MIAAHDRASFLRRRRAEFAEPLRPGAVDQSREEQIRTVDLPGANRVSHRDEQRPLRAHVAHRRDARGEIRRNPLDLVQMRVVVPQARDDRLARDVDAARALRNRRARARPGGDDATVVDDDRRVRDRRRAGRVDQRRADERERCLRRSASLLRRDARELRHLRARGDLHQLVAQRQQRGAHRLERQATAAAGREHREAAVRVEPEVVDPPDDAIDRVAREQDATRARSDGVDGRAS